MVVRGGMALNGSGECCSQLLLGGGTPPSLPLSSYLFREVSSSLAHNGAQSRLTAGM